MKFYRAIDLALFILAFSFVICAIINVKTANAGSHSISNSQYLEGYNYYETGQYGKAIQRFSDSFVSAQHSLSAYMTSVCFFYAKDLKSAQDWARLALRTHPPLSVEKRDAMRLMIRGLREGEYFLADGRSDGMSLPIPSPTQLPW